MSYEIKQLKWQWINDNGKPETSEGVEIGTDNSTATFFQETDANNSKIVKLAIQAPQGTSFEINDTEFIIGRFGVLEFNDENIIISSVILKAPKKAALNEEDSRAAIEEGITMMDQALISKLQNTNATMTISKENINDYGTLSSNIIWSQEENKIIEANYNNINQLLTNSDYTSIATEQAFIQAYTEGYTKYIEGARGIYNTDIGKVQDIDNVIIDMVIKKGDENL